jgi:large subunit ribosomal protein L25
MQDITITALARTQFGKNAAGLMRRNGQIPAIVYGISATQHIAVDAEDFKVKFRYISENTIIPMQIGDKKIDVLLKEYQHDIVRDKILHLDFYEIKQDKKIHAKVPVKLLGQAIGQRDGGVVDHLLHEIDLECMPRFMPKQVELDISGLKIGDSLHVSNIKPLENIKFLSAADTTVVTLSHPKEDATLVVAEAPAEAPAKGKAGKSGKK